MVEVKPSGKCYCDESIREDYKSPERREWLEIALCDAVKKIGTDRKHFKKVRVGLLFSSRQTVAVESHV